MFRKPIVFFTLALVLLACSGITPTPVSAIEAIERIQELAGFPPSTVSYIVTTGMINSPTGDLQVDLYEDEQGRKFFVDPVTGIVVEVDARTLLDDLSADPSPGNLSDVELEGWALEFVRLAVPQFSSMESSLTYEPGGKGNMHFFTWRAANTENFFMPPFVQVGLTNTGEMFAFYNTVTSH